MTSSNSVQAAAGWMLRNAGEGALFCCIVRVDDLAIAGDPKLAPRDVLHLFEDRLPELHERLESERKAALAKSERKREKAGK